MRKNNKIMLITTIGLMVILVVLQLFQDGFL